MTWRIKAIALYQREGPGREVLEFETRGLNVISGNSQTGKSAIIDIVNYCLMSRSCSIPKGFIRRAVSHVALHIENANSELQVVRPLPDQGAKSSTTAWWQIGTGLAFPNEVPELRWTREEVRGVLSDFTGISGADVLTNTQEPGGPEFQATIRHAIPLIFQPQDVIANRHVSFPGLDSVEKRRGIIDALPFLLKIESADLLEKRAELRKHKTDLRTKTMQGAEKRMLRASAFPRGMRIWNECQANGLVEGDLPSTIPELLSSLGGINVPDELRVELSTVAPDLSALERAEQDARSSLTRVRRQIRELKQFEDSAKLHDDVVSGQIRRLHVAQLLPTPSGTSTCPVCHSGMLNSQAAKRELEQALVGLTNIKTIPLRIDEKARRARSILESERDLIEEKHEVARTALRQGVELASRETPQAVQARRIDVLRGKVEEYIESVSLAAIDEQDDGIAELRAKISELQALLNTRDGVRTAFERKVSDEMTELARQMDVEFINGRAHLDLEDLTISVQVDPREDAMTTLSEIGSGANWVSYHIAAATALHRHLTREDCPVPRVLILDQPSQAWFPKLPVRSGGEPSTPDSERPHAEKPEDLERVQKIYKLLLDESSRDRASQIIVLDHAYIDEEWFTKAIVKEWRGGEKLVPPHWDRLQQA